MSKILYGLMLLLLIPLSSYSQELTQDTLHINKYQIQSILKDHSRLVFLEKTTKQDSLIIKELNYQIVNHKRINTNNEIRITNFEQLLKVETRKHKVYKRLFIFACIVLPPTTFMLINK